ncbi:putative Protein PhnO [Rhodospirillaceae bacterium LM-1]|nr:putative Protein PhnO [Rhodospirillaceae bacterium LM-1]
MRINIRPIGDFDLAKAAPLCGELGYPATGDELAPRLAKLKDNDDNLLLLAEGETGDALGVIHAGYLRMFIEAPQVIVLSLVVAETARGNNVGAKLLKEAEAWAKTKGVGAVMIGSNVVRERAHKFYHAHGYREIKRWSVLKKMI